jgi:hypothetical protein
MPTPSHPDDAYGRAIEAIELTPQWFAQTFTRMVKHHSAIAVMLETHEPDQPLTPAETGYLIEHIAHLMPHMGMALAHLAARLESLEARHG